MDSATLTPVAQLRAALEGARDALASSAEGSGVAGDALPRMSSSELAEFMRLADQVKARAAATQVRLTAEAAHRGEFSSARRGVGSVHSWVREHAPSLRQGGAGQVAQLAQDVACSTPGGLWSTRGPGAGAYADPQQPEGIVWARVVTGEIGPALALTALREVARMKDRLNPAMLPDTTTAVLDHGVQWGCQEARRVRPHLVALYGREGEFDEQQQRLRSGAFLSSPQVADGDLTEYRMAMTPEQASRLEAAIGPMSRPAPNDATGERDLRPAGQRRVEALAAVCGQVAAQDAAHATPGGAATTMHVKIGLNDLTGARSDPESSSDEAAGPAASASGRAGCGRVMATRAEATMLAPSLVRQLACDADIIPLVLGSDGEILDVGRAVRLFTRGQRRALWHRDAGCTYPGCDAPSGWTQAHHLVHWVDGGPSDLADAALLCPRHHTQVHDQRLIATVDPPDDHGRSVSWNLIPGSYDRDLPERLTAIRRARTGERAHLDTGSPDPWVSEPSDELIEAWVERWMADDEAAEHDSALAQALFDDALPTMLAAEPHPSI